MTTRIHVGDALTVLRTLPEASVHCVVTSPPYFALRDYGTETWDGGDSACDHLGEPFRTSANINANCGTGVDVKNATKRQPMGAVCTKCGARRVDKQIGLEDTPEQFVVRLVEVFREVRRVLRDDGVCWVNMGDSYASNKAPGGTWGASSGSNRNAEAARRASFRRDRADVVPSHRMVPGCKPKDLIGIPWMLAFALRADGWFLRSDCIWSKPNPMPESVEDRPTKAHEYVFLLSKSKEYFYDVHAVRQAYADSTLPQKGRPYGGVATKDYAQGRVQDPSDTKRRVVESMERRGGANLRTVWTIPTQAFRGAHFATFPKALADRCILAGTSAHGACPDCAAPWERVVVKSGGTTGRSWNVRRDEDGQDPNGAQLSNTTKDGTYTVDHQGWHPTCACRGEWFWDPPFRYVPWLPEVLAIDDDEGIVVLEAVRRWRLKDGEVAPVLRPCVVMDPFTGAGTTALSAASLSRDFVGVELNLEFARMAARRIDADMPLFGQTILVVP